MDLSALFVKFNYCQFIIVNLDFEMPMYVCLQHFLFWIKYLDLIIEPSPAWQFINNTRSIVKRCLYKIIEKPRLLRILPQIQEEYWYIISVGSCFISTSSSPGVNLTIVAKHENKFDCARALVQQETISSLAFPMLDINKCPSAKFCKDINLWCIFVIREGSHWIYCTYIFCRISCVVFKQLLWIKVITKATFFAKLIQYLSYPVNVYLI